MRSKNIWFAAAGAAAGLINGFFGGGGGMILVPLLAGKCGLTQQKAFATSVAVIAPLCALSAGIYWYRGNLDFLTALPYLAGGLVGGWLGGKLYGKVPTRWLKWLFAGFLFYAGVKYLL